jgi:sirohydrochlorin ferrochelatase
MRPPYLRSIARLGVRPDRPAAFVGSRPRGSRRPHADATVAAVRRLVEQSVLTYSEIAAKTGVAPASICRWTRGSSRCLK